EPLLDDLRGRAVGAPHAGRRATRAATEGDRGPSQAGDEPRADWTEHLGAGPNRAPLRSAHRGSAITQRTGRGQRGTRRPDPSRDVARSTVAWGLRAVRHTR